MNTPLHRNPARLRVLGAAFVGALALLGAPPAQAGIDFVDLGTVVVPVGDGASVGAQLLVSNTGQVVLVTSARDSARVIPVDVDTGESEVIAWSYNGMPVEPISSTFGPEGDVLLRGSTGDPNMPLGVTGRIKLDGTVVWAQPDTNFAQDPTYIGRYVTAEGPIAWSGIRQRVLIFSQSSFDVASVSQASALFEFNGDTRKPSVLFGDEYIGATLGNALTRPDGLFFVYYLSQNDVGARFFVYDGFETIQSFDAEGGDWSQRIVYDVQYDPEGNLILLWNDVATREEAGHLTKLDPEGKLVWETPLAGSIMVKDPESQTDVAATMGRPIFMITASEEIVLLRPAGPTYVFDARSSTDGAPLGFFDFFNLTGNLIFDLKFLPGSERTYLVSTAVDGDMDNTHLLQLQLRLNDEPVEIMDPEDVNSGGNNTGIGGNNGGPIVNPDEDDDDNNTHARPDVCGCRTLAPAAPDAWPLALLALGLIGAVVLGRHHPGRRR